MNHKSRSIISTKLNANEMGAYMRIALLKHKNDNDSHHISMVVVSVCGGLSHLCKPSTHMSNTQQKLPPQGNGTK